MRKHGWLVWNKGRAWRLFLPKTGDTFTSKHVSFGSNRLNIPVTAHPFRPGELGFPVQCRAAGKGRWHLPPLIGILTSEHPSIPGFRGNKANFRDIVETGRRMGVLVFVFTPNGVKDSGSEIVGFTRHPAVKGWVRLAFPKPHVVYNRIPDRKAERQPAEQKALRMFLESEDTQLFNPRFFDKEELWHWTASDDTLKYLQPVTEIWGDQATLTHFLDRFNALYLKPVSGKAGKGIMQIKQEANSYLLTFVTGRGRELKRFRTRFSRILYEKVNRLTNGERYLIQQGVSLAQYNGHPFDLRTLVQKDSEGEWDVTGLGIRLAGKQGVTTHVPRGGSIGKPENIFPRVFGSEAKQLYNRALELAVAAARAIERQSGHALGELSLDLGIDRNHRFWLFEANAKPMKFDEPLIRKRSLERIIQYAVYLAEGRERSAHS